MPLADAILRAVVRTVPDPQTAQANKLGKLFPKPQVSVPSTGTSENGAHQVRQVTSEQTGQVQQTVERIKGSVAACTSAEDEDVIVFVSKMIPVRVAELSPVDAAFFQANGLADDGTTQQHSDEYAGDKEVFLALGRVFAGTLRSHHNRSMYVLGHHYNPYEYTEGDAVNAKSRVQLVGMPESLGLYMCLGPSVCPVSCVPAGNVVAIFGLDKYILKSATLSSTPLSFPMTAITFQTKPMLRVAVEPAHHHDLHNLEEGMKKLYQYDPVVEVSGCCHSSS